MTDHITLPRAVVERLVASWGRDTIAFIVSMDTLRAALAEPEHIHTCGPDCQKPLCVNRRREIAAAVEAEREACAKICDGEATLYYSAQRCATKLRARGCQK
jgi:hypothetical protein